MTSWFSMKEIYVKFFRSDSGRDTNKYGYFRQVVPLHLHIINRFA